MRDLNNWEQEIVHHLSSLQPGTSMDMIGFLNSIYFRRDLGKALILNVQAKYAMFFVKAQLFFDNDARKNEISKFLNLFSFLKYLSNEGYLSFHPIERGTEAPVYYVQDSFDKNLVSGNGPVVLNSIEDCLSASDTILTKDKKPFCKGIIFEHETYDLIAKTVVNGFILTKDLSELSLVRPAYKRRGMSILPITLSLMVLVALIVVFALIRVEMRGNGEQLARLLESHDQIREDIKQIKERSFLAGPSEAERDKTQVHYGIDVSKWNGDILTDLKEMDSISFVICKASEGIDYVDPDFESNSTFLNERKIIWGVYHFFHTADDPIKQADFFLKIADQRMGDIAPIVDIEQASLTVGEQPSSTKMQVDLLLFLSHIERSIGRVPMIYTDEAFASQYLNNETFAKYPLWLAEYSNGRYPVIPEPWKAKGFKIWQKSSSYSVKSRLVDLDAYFGNLGDLR